MTAGILEEHTHSQAVFTKKSHFVLGIFKTQGGALELQNGSFSLKLKTLCATRLPQYCHT